ncbi:MAG: ATP/GTP-binding protein [Haliscomenobacter sp.]|nr:ATP/GTP-binding protein [Haliscomenobacter sp.]
MKKYLLTLLGLFIVLFSCKNNVGKSEKTVDNSAPTLELKKLWESDTLFTTSESALYDAASNTIYVSNIEGEPWGADGKGSIGKLATDGTTIAAKWATGLSAPKGMAIANGKLYTADITHLVEIDLATGKITKKYAAPGAEGLNDVTSTSDGTIYFTDSIKGTVYQLKDGAVATIVEGLGGSNGILHENGTLLLGIWKDSTLVQYNLGTKKFKKLASKVPQPDGIEAVGDGAYLVSSWSGLVHYVQPDGKTSLLLNSQVDSISSADIDYVQAKKWLLVPTFFRNTVAAYELVK